MNMNYKYLQQFYNLQNKSFKFVENETFFVTCKEFKENWINNKIISEQDDHKIICYSCFEWDLLFWKEKGRKRWMRAINL